MSGEPCPCGGADFATCCAPLITGARLPETAEQLMRSRYTAYSRGDEAYLLQTWHASTRPTTLALHAQPPTHWLGLKVIATHDGGAAHERGTVEFVARYKIGGKAHRLHEVSRFVREAGRWYYLDAETTEGPM